MAEQYCNKCGAGLVAGARFCRQCGQPMFDSQLTSVTEGTTEVLPRYAETEAPTRHFNQATTGPAYIAPPVQQTPLSPLPSAFPAPKKKRRGRILLLSFVIFTVIAAGSLVVLSQLLRHMRRPIPPPPPPPPVISIPGPVVASGMDALIYPGAKTMMDVRKEDEGRVLQLTTKDPFDKVVSWYEKNLHPTKRVIQPPTQAVLKSDEYSVVIHPDGNGMAILLKEAQ